MAIWRQMPFAEDGRAVPVLFENPGQRCTVAWQRRRITGKATSEFTDRAKPHRMVIAPGHQRSSGRRAKCGDVEPVVAKALLRSPREVGRLDRATERARVAEPSIVDEDQEHVGRALRWCGVAHQVPVRLRSVKRLADPSRKGRPADRQTAAIDITHVALRSGAGWFRIANPTMPDRQFLVNPLRLAATVERAQARSGIDGTRGWTDLQSRQQTPSAGRSGAAGWVSMAVGNHDRPDRLPPWCLIRRATPRSGPNRIADRTREPSRGGRSGTAARRVTRLQISGESTLAFFLAGEILLAGGAPYPDGSRSHLGLRDRVLVMPERLARARGRCTTMRRFVRSTFRSTFGSRTQCRKSQQRPSTHSGARRNDRKLRYTPLHCSAKPPRLDAGSPLRRPLSRRNVGKAHPGRAVPAVLIHCVHRFEHRAVKARRPTCRAPRRSRP